MSNREIMTHIMTLLASKKLIAFSQLLWAVVGLIVLCILKDTDKEVTVSIITWLGGPTAVAGGTLIGVQGMVDHTQAKRVYDVPSK